MADIQKSFDDLVKANEELFKKFQEYLDASDYSGKDPKKWLGDLAKAIKAVETALGDTESKLDTMKKAFDEYVKLNKATIERDKAVKDNLKKALDVMNAIEGNINKVRVHLAKHKA